MSSEKSWEDVQKKAFTHWVNSYLEKKGDHVDELATAFSNGVRLVTFLELVTKKEFTGKVYRAPKLKIHFIENVNLCLRFIQQEGVKGLTISAEDFVDGNLKMLLGFCWICLRHFGRNSQGADGASFEEGLLSWLKKQLEDYELNITDFKNSFNDGKALLALVHRWDPDVVDYNNRDLSNPVTNAETALKLIEQHVKVPALLDATELTKGETREKQIVLYLSLIQKSFQDEEEKRRLAGEGQAKVLSLREQLQLLNEENSTMSESISVLQEKVDVLTKLLEAETEEKNELKAETEALSKAKESLEKEKKLLTVERDDLVKQLKAAKRAREELEEAVQSATKRNGLGLDAIRKNLLEHVADLSIWKEFLEQDRDYKAPSVTLVQEDAVKGKEFEGQIAALNSALVDENVRLEKLLVDRREEAKNKATMFSDEEEPTNKKSKSKK
jgi:hypothetical protein